MQFFLKRNDPILQSVPLLASETPSPRRSSTIANLHILHGVYRESVICGAFVIHNGVFCFECAILENKTGPSLLLFPNRVLFGPWHPSPQENHKANKVSVTQESETVAKDVPFSFSNSKWPEFYAKRQKAPGKV